MNSAHFVGEPFNYAVPAERIKWGPGSAGVENTVSETTETYRAGIRAYFEGDRDTAVAELTEVLEEQPANGLAETYLAKAKKLPAPAETRRRLRELGRVGRPRRWCRRCDRRRLGCADARPAEGAPSYPCGRHRRPAVPRGRDHTRPAGAGHAAAVHGPARPGGLRPERGAGRCSRP